MLQLPIYMDNQATTRVDPRVLEAMLPYFGETYGNSGSTNHSFGREAREAVDASRMAIAQVVGAGDREIVFTSGATESNNLAIRGIAMRERRRGNHAISVTTEHKAVLDPLARLQRRGWDVILLRVNQTGSDYAGLISADQVAAAIRTDTALVSVMLANNEIGAIQPIAEIARVCREHNVPLHCDATQAVGKIPVDVRELNVDLMSFSAHKLYGPKGIGALYVRRRSPAIRLEPQIDGGGQEFGLRSGTLNTPGIVGFAKALQLCTGEMTTEQQRLSALRTKMWHGLSNAISDIYLNGPSLDDASLRLAGNLNVAISYVDGEALMINMRDFALSSGSACTSANPEPSHVLRGLGLSDELTRSSLRFGLGRFNTEEEVDFAIVRVAETVTELRRLSSLA